MRQRDLLFPLLFCPVEEVLNRGISILVASNQINLVKGFRNCFVNSHTIYVNDIMIFCRGDHKSLPAIANLLNNYASCSGHSDHVVLHFDW